MEIVNALCLQLLRSHGKTRIVDAVFFKVFAVVFQFIDQVTTQIGFAHGHALFIIGIGQLRYADIGLYAAFLHRTTRWQMVARNGEAKARVPRQRQDTLHRSLAETAFTHDQAAMVILQCARHNFGCRCRASVNQNDDRRAAGDIARNGAFGPPALDVAFVTAAFGNNLATRQESIGNGNGFIQYATGVGPQVNDVTQRISAKRFLYAGDSSDNVSAGLFGETGN